MKKLTKIISIFLVVICVMCIFASCISNTPLALETSKKGDRVDFSREGIASASMVETIKKGEQSYFTFNIAGYSNVDYLNCACVVDVTYLIVHSDMTEETKVKTLDVKLPFNGNYQTKIAIDTDKEIHAIYDASYNIHSFSGELIKKS